MPAHLYDESQPCACDRCAEMPSPGDRFGAWTCESTGGNCTAWMRPAYAAAPCVRWLVTEQDEAQAPRPRARGPVTLSLEANDGTIWLQAECPSFRAAESLAARFGLPS